MKAIFVTAAGGPEVLQLREAVTPQISGAHEVLVRLHAAGVNPVDTKLRTKNGYHPSAHPYIPGCDGAGVVEAAGDAVTRVKPGDAVFFCHGGIGGAPGNYAEYAVLHEDYCALKPARLGMTEAAALPLVLITAWEALFERAHLQPGETVLIHAAAGGVGHVAVQLAKERGARVFATVSSTDKAAFVKTLGADLAIDYKQQDFVEAVLHHTQGKGADVVFDTVGGETFAKSFDATKVYGRVATLLAPTCDAAQWSVARQRNLIIAYTLMLTPMFYGMHDALVAQRSILETGAHLIETGKLEISVGRVLPLAQAADAHRLIESGHSTGKIVLATA
ncbi:MAG: zinc-dependent alcohol dehydrogenase family protein [Pseudomonadota bacterium]